MIDESKRNYLDGPYRSSQTDREGAVFRRIRDREGVGNYIKRVKRMARKYFEILKVAVEKTGWFMRYRAIPAIQECVYFLSRAIDFIVELIGDKDYKYKAEFVSANEVLSTSNYGFCIDGRRKLSSSHSQMHAMIVGASGSGKTQCCVLPTILEATGSLIINDPSGELFVSASGYLKTKGYDIVVINFSNHAVSNGYNPFARIENVSDCQKIAHMLIRSTLKSGNDPFWNLQAVSLVTLLMRALLSEDRQYQHFAHVRHLIQMLSADHSIVDRLIARTGNTQLIAEYKSFLSFDNKVRLGIQATCLASLQIFCDPTVAKVTSADTLHLEQLRVRRTAIFIHCHTSDSRFYSELISIFFEQLSKVIMSKLPGKKDLPIYYILDEFSSLYLPSIQITISNLRKYKSGIMIICQDYQQIVDVDGRQQAESIRANCFGKLYFGGVSHTTATELSAQLGRFEYEDEKGRKVRQLLEPDEIRILPRDKAIFICGNFKPNLLHLTPTYKHPFFKLRTQIASPHLTSTLSDEEIKLLDE